MNLLRKIQAFLKDGYPVPADSPDGVALPRAAALGLISAMEGSKLAIRAIDVWQMEIWGPMPTQEEWSCRRLSLEAASDYASRSRHAALEFINSRPDDSKAMFAFEIDEQQEAA